MSLLHVMTTNLFFLTTTDLRMLTTSVLKEHTNICHQVRVTNLDDASEHIGEVLRRVKKEHLQRAYKIQEWYFPPECSYCL